MKKFMVCALLTGTFLIAACKSDDDAPAELLSACYDCTMINYEAVVDGSGTVCIENDRLDIDAGFDGQAIKTQLGQTPEAFIASLVADGAQCTLVEAEEEEGLSN